MLHEINILSSAMHVESLVRDEDFFNQDSLIQEVLNSPPPQLANSGTN